MKYLLILPLTVFMAEYASAEFSKGTPSINGTSELLGDGRGEIVFTSLSYGATEKLTLTIPTIPLLYRAVSLGGRYRAYDNGSIVVAPEGSVGFWNRITIYSAGLGSTVRVGSSKRHTFTGKGKVSYVPKFNLSTRFVETSDSVESEIVELKIEDQNDLNSQLTTSFRPSVEYDYYTSSGNLAYLGFEGVPYLGFTWAWDSVHAGVVWAIPVTMWGVMPAP